MVGTKLVIELFGSIALLLWSTRMIQSGVQGAFGHILKGKMQGALRSRFFSIVIGGLLAVLLQSSTAAALLIAGLSGAGFVVASRGVLAVLGADLGSATMTLILQLEFGVISWVAVSVGYFLFKGSKSDYGREIGRLCVGVGLLILSLSLIRSAVEPLQSSELIEIAFANLAYDWMFIFLVAAVVTVLLHSSIATVLLIATFADYGVLETVHYIPIILGVNAGAAFIPVLLSKSNMEISRTVVIANFVLRAGSSCVMLLVFVGFLKMDIFLAFLSSMFSPGEVVAMLHVLFNGFILILGLFVAGWLTTRIEIRATMRVDTGRDMKILNEADLVVPAVAIGNASRLTLEICEKVERLIQIIPYILRESDAVDIASLEALDDEIDQMHSDIKIYLAKVPVESLSDVEAAKIAEIMNAVVKLEQIGDLVAHGVGVKARKRIERGIALSPESSAELEEIHEIIMENARRAFSVLISGDVNTARKVVSCKEQLRMIELACEASHMERLRNGIEPSVEASSLFIDCVRDLKEINSLMTRLVYPVLERARMLHKSRLAG